MLFFQVYFQRLTRDILSGARFFADVMDGTTLRPNWYNDTSGQLYLPSYSTDNYNPYHTPVGSTNNHSAYFVQV